MTENSPARAAIVSRKSHNATTLALFLVLGISALGGGWYWYTDISTPTPIIIPEPFVQPRTQSQTTPTAPRNAATLSESNDLDALLIDLTNTDLTQLEAYLVAVDEELASAAAALSSSTPYRP